MDKEKALKLLNMSIQSTKRLIGTDNLVNDRSRLSYLNGRLEVFEEIKRSIESGYWD